MEDIKGKPAKGDWGRERPRRLDEKNVKDTTEFLGPDRNLVQRMASPMVRLSRWFSNRRLRKSSEYWQGFEDTIKAAVAGEPRADSGKRQFPAAAYVKPSDTGYDAETSHYDADGNWVGDVPAQQSSEYWKAQARGSGASKKLPGLDGLTPEEMAEQYKVERVKRTLRGLLGLRKDTETTSRYGTDIVGQRMDPAYFEPDWKPKGLMARTKGPDPLGRFPGVEGDPYGTMYYR